MRASTVLFGVIEQLDKSILMLLARYDLLVGLALATAV